MFSRIKEVLVVCVGLLQLYPGETQLSRELGYESQIFFARSLFPQPTNIACCSQHRPGTLLLSP